MDLQHIRKFFRQLLIEAPEKKVTSTACLMLLSLVLIRVGQPVQILAPYGNRA